MNSKVIKSLMKFRLVAKTPGGKTSVGDVTYTEQNYNCYVAENQEIVQTAIGKETLSTLQVYVVGVDALAISKNCVLDVGTLIPQEDDENSMTFLPLYQNKEILKRQIFYKKNAQADVGVFYLP